MKIKECFKCHLVKDLKEFYKHKGMADGHLNKCKDCTKKDVGDRYSDPGARERIREYEKKRFQDPERKKRVVQYQRESRARDPEKARVRNKTRNLIRDGKLIREPCEICGEKMAQAHHVTYDDALNIKWLCFKHHREEHGQQVE